MHVIFDSVHFEHMTGGDRALQVEVIGLFRAQVADWGLLLAPDQPASVWRGAAHTIKGSARGIGLWVLADTCERAEAASYVSGAEVTAALGDINAALAEALEALDKFSGEETAL